MPGGPLIPHVARTGCENGGMSIWFGAHVADDSELRLCGDVAGKRVVELGIAPVPNSIAFAAAGARAIAVDPDANRITGLRQSAERAEVTVQCHQSDLADLGFATSASVDLVIASHSLGGVDDLPRVLRQVHRVLKPGCAFVVALQHPVAAMFGGDHVAQYAYGAISPTFTDLYMSFERADFHFDQMLELDDRRVSDPLTPTVLLMRARKLGV